jgi:hypothetical protein
MTEVDGRSDFKWLESTRTNYITFENPSTNLINIKSTWAILDLTLKKSIYPVIKLI